MTTLGDFFFKRSIIKAEVSRKKGIRSSQLNGTIWNKFIKQNANVLVFDALAIKLDLTSLLTRFFGILNLNRN
jgi:hypothetical protein